MPDRDGEVDAFVVPPVPLASGSRLPDPDGRRVAGVALVVTTEDGGRREIRLRQEHGAWWAPPEG
ncbi:hypothetical protein [Modestobacter sp. Leaf380]|uniref:hypothetical protein n=1 Tax=Modestobacter sp. Leaf380 TaxID=1736356 RepID=UPI0006FA22E2|nr:hypothetical protein [Modestobacter sp. Leaf380]KQS68372.1 hypothetical protein ASG41_05075 [Modestobacter sp. Leaf380]